MFISGDKIQLRALEPGDVDLLYQWENNREVWHLSRTLTPFSRFDIEQYVLNAGRDIFADKQVRLMIDERNGSVTVGAIDLFDYDPLHQRAGIGIIIHETHRNQGFAAEALRLVTGYCFGTLMLHQVFANILAGNEKSIRLFEKAGFSNKRKKREWVKSGNVWKDELFYQFINPES